MRANRGLAQALAGLVACLVLASPQGAAAIGLPPSVNMTGPCYTAPWDAACAGFKRTDAEWTDDLDKLCNAMPFMIGCSMRNQCESGVATATSPFCSLPSLVAAICGPDQMGGMKGCEAWNALCKPGNTSVVQCKDPGAPAPNVPTTYTTKEDIDSVCTEMTMDGCQDCPRGNVYSQCPDPFGIYGQLCVAMPGMYQCEHWHQFCNNADAAAAFPKFCSGNAADGSSTSLPPMKMYFHQSAREMFLFKEWVPGSAGAYVGMCIGMCALAVLTQFLKAVRLRVEMRWSAAERRMRCACPTSALDSASDLESSGCKPGGAKRPPSPGSEDAAGVAELPPCCRGKADGAPAADCPASVPVPTSSRPKYWLRGVRVTGEEGALVVGGYQLMTRRQFWKNFWRGCFTFFVIFLDYALMLVVMTFNVGIILAVCGGFAIGALLFGHAGEPDTLKRRGGGDAAVLRAPTLAPAPLSAHAVAPPAAEEEELETVFVEGAGCCSGNSGYGGGGHGGGHL